jgi:hypothetical protein
MDLDAFPARMAIRNTWGRYLASANNPVKISLQVQDVSIIFLVNKSKQMFADFAIDE